METIEFRGVTFSYPLSDKRALKDVSFDVGESEFVVLCGKSGCGKSTLLKHMKKNMIPYGDFSGSVLYNGLEVSQLDDRKNAAEIGFVGQNPDNQIVTDQVWHELAFGLESLGLDNRVIKRRVAEMASYFGIQTWFRKQVSQLSGGQKQLLNLASIMAMQPKILILDEPTSQLDPIAASEFLQTVHKINRDLGTTVFLSEHRLEEAFAMADKVMVMNEGSVIAYDTPRKIGGFLSGTSKKNRHPMFYGLPSVMKIFEEAGGKGDSPLTIREGRLWLQSEIPNAELTYIGEELPDDKNNEIAVSAQNLWFRYDKKSQEVLKGLTVDVPKGKLFCVLGGNGVGKSTTLKAISGIIKPQRGTIEVNGTYGMLPQNPQALFTEITAEEELLEALYYSGKSDEEKVMATTQMLERMEISHLNKAHPYDLSGGEQQRLALGKILLLEPEILLLDEPTKGLDPFFKLTLAKILRDLLKEGVTIFMVSHDIEFCAEHGDVCAMFFDGDIVTAGTPRRFFSGNNFYTTAANKIARERFPDAITWEEVATCLKERP